MLLPFDIELPGLGEFASIAANGWLLGREYFELAALRHLSLAEAGALRRENGGAVWAVGVLIALTSMVPLLNLVAPLVRRRADGASVSSRCGPESDMRKNPAILTLFALAGCVSRPAAPAAPVAPPPAVTVPLPPPPPRGEPDLFTGIDVPRLRALMGAPAFARKDGNVEMWRYDAASCHAYFFLTGMPARVQHVETLPRGKDSAADPDCLSALKSSAKPS